MKKLITAGCLLFMLSFSATLIAQTDSTGFLTSFDGSKIYYEVRGLGAPVVLVHGFTGTGEGWKRSALYNDLRQQGNKVIIIDLRGNGKSDKPHDATAYANDAEAKDVMALVTKLKIKKYSVAGYSRGSIITARLLVLDKRVDKAVLGGMGADFTNPNWPRRIFFYRALAGDTTNVLEDMLKRIQETGLDRQALAMQQKEQPSTSKEALGKIKQPVLIICGSEDEDNGSAAELSKLIPHALYKTVPGKHGGTSNTQPYANEVIAFLKN
jgi:pimeloyl-ACP methyl ester carboxylesterase